MRGYFFRTAAFALSIIMLVFCCGCAGKNESAPDFNGTVIAVGTGAYSSLAAAEYTSQGAVLEKFSSVSDCVAALKAGKVDYALASEYEAALFLESDSALKKAYVCSYKTNFFAIFHKDGELLQNFNSAIAALKEDGTIGKIKEAALNNGNFNKTPLKGGNGILRVAIDATFPPFSEVDSNGEACGTDADIANEVCAEMNMELDMRVLDFDEAYFALLNDEIDVIMSSAENDSERKSAVYSDSYFESGYVLLSK